MNISEAIEKIEKKIEYTFENKKLVKSALTHSSFSNEKRFDKSNNNERLEFLGDAVLELVTSEFLFKNNDDMHEGELTRLRASIVCEPTLAFCAKEISLGEYLLLGKGEALTGGRERASILSDALEAIIGAIFLDGGFTNAKEFINRFILADIDNKKLFYDSKTILQEMIQSQCKEPLTYKLITEEGPDHNKTFKVAALIGEKTLAIATGRTKKAAEQEAAYLAIVQIRDSGGKICI